MGHWQQMCVIDASVASFQAITHSSQAPNQNNTHSSRYSSNPQASQQTFLPSENIIGKKNREIDTIWKVIDKPGTTAFSLLYSQNFPFFPDPWEGLHYFQATWAMWMMFMKDYSGREIEESKS